MDFLKPIAKHILIPLYDIKEGQRIASPLKDMQRSQFFSQEALGALQFKRFQEILNYAYTHCPFYRDRLDEHGIAPSAIRSFHEIPRIPILTKDDIRNHSDDMISSEFRKADLVYKRTGGSTSVPIKLYVDPLAYRMKKAATARHDLWAGFERGDKIAALWGDTDKPYSLKEKLFTDLIARAVYLDTLRMDDHSMAGFIDRLRRFKPRILLGHAHSLYEFSRFLLEQDCRDIGFKGVISTAEVLYDNERRTIERVFGKILFNRYGSEELSIIASECEQHDGLHINAEGLYVEVLEGDENTPGKLVITDLYNRGMPFIRYEIGDMATTRSGPCACGRGLPRLGAIHGRTADFLYTAEGKKVSGISILDTFTIHVPGIKQVQIIQNQMDALIFKIVKSRDFSNESQRLLEANIPKYFGDTMQYRLEFVQEIPLTARGKYRFSICNVPDAPRGA